MSWEKITLKTVSEIVSGATPKTSNEDYWDGDINWFSPKDLSKLEGKYVKESPRKITQLGLSSCSARLLPEQSVLFSSRAPIGLVAINRLSAATNQGFKSIVPNRKKLLSDFLYWWLKANKKNISNLGRGATFKEVSKKIIESLQIPLPPLEEQKRIAAILDDVDESIRLRKDSIKALDDLIQSTFISMFGSNEDVYTVQEMLDSGMLVLHKDGNHGGSYPRKSEFSVKGIPFISAKNIDEEGNLHQDGIQMLNEKKARTLTIGWLQPEDVLLAHNASVGKCSLYKGEFNEALIGTSLTAYRVNKIFIVPEFLYACIRSDYFQHQLFKIMGQSTRNQVPITAQRRLSLKVPTITEQKAFAEILQSIEDQKSLYQDQLNELEGYFQCLQQKAFKGEL